MSTTTDATVLGMACKDARDTMPTTTLCHRNRGHLPPHRGAEPGTGKLVSWGYDFPEVVPDQHDMPGTREARPGPFGGADGWRVAVAKGVAAERLAGGLDEHAETWTDDDGWTYAGGRRQPDPLEGVWAAVAAVGPTVVYSLAVLLAWLAPALVLLVWRAALR